MKQGGRWAAKGCAKRNMRGEPKSGTTTLVPGSASRLRDLGALNYLSLSNNKLDGELNNSQCV